MKRARITTLHTAAKSRPSGYLEACMAAGKVSADGQWVIFTDTGHNALRAQYNPALHAITSKAAALQKPRAGAAPCPDPKRFPCGRSAP